MGNVTPFLAKMSQYRTENFQDIHSRDSKIYNLRVILTTLKLDHAILDAVLSQFIICQRKTCNDNVQICKCGNCLKMQNCSLRRLLYQKAAMHFTVQCSFAL